MVGKKCLQYLHICSWKLVENMSNLGHKYYNVPDEFLACDHIELRHAKFPREISLERDRSNADEDFAHLGIPVCGPILVHEKVGATNDDVHKLREPFN